MTASTPRILLIGMMGAGKSTTGHLLAARLGWPYLDSDERIIAETGLSVPEIWHQRGEAAFRAEETRVLTEATGSAEPVVIAVAGGAVLDPGNRERIRAGGLVVWLRADVATLAERVGEGVGRPLLDGGPAAALGRLATDRTPVYADLADVVIDVDHRSPEQVVEVIVGAATTAGVVGA